jgi:creatinine amidohydrolase
MAEAPVAYLPLGTFEWHGEHLPLGADSLQSTAFFNELTNQAGGIVMPMLFLGPNPRLEKDGNTFYGMDFWYDEGSMKQAPTPSKLDGSAYWVSDSLFVQFLEGTLANLVRAGFKMVVAHGHGPSTNQFNQHLASWETKFGMKLMSCWFENNNAENGIMCDHAAMNETSLVMHYFPELVKMNQLPIDTAQELRGVAGKDPRKFASPELGREIVEQNLERMKVLIKNELGNL